MAMWAPATPLSLPLRSKLNHENTKHQVQVRTATQMVTSRRWSEHFEQGRRLSVRQSLGDHLTKKAKQRLQREIVWASVRGGIDGIETDSTVTSSVRTREELKKLVMQAVSNTNRGKAATYKQRQHILELLEELEVQTPTADPINSPLFSGRWALLYTAPIDEKTSDKYAGTEEGPFLSRIKPVTFGSVRQTRSFQVIDAEGGAAENIADFTVLGVNGLLTIYAKVVKAAASDKGAVRIDVTFESFVVKLGSFQLPPVSLSWINPKGWIDTTFLDDNFRIGRGDKGSIFAAVRAK